ncbi:MAG: hypothetical protein U5L03_01080 [Burkholderiaceae bacterium]|nr:hypothetical protein [Burkholderiaceae bacterium]
MCGYALAELEPRLFSFNNPIGACPSCDGLGTVEFFDDRRVVVHPELSLASGAIKGGDGRSASTTVRCSSSLAERYRATSTRRGRTCRPLSEEGLLHGTGDAEVPFGYAEQRGRRMVRHHPFEGVLPNMERRFRETDSAAVREELAKYLHRSAAVPRL